MLFMSTVTMKLRDLAASMIPHLMRFAETGRLRQTHGAVSIIEIGEDDFPEEIDPEALHILVQYLQNQWIPPHVKPAYDALVKSLRYDS